MAIQVKKLTDDTELLTAFAIRRTVFVEEQQVEPADEFDQYESSSHHFLAWYQGKPCGAARWRLTEKGIKLERFAVLKEFRSKGVGSALVESVLNDIEQINETKGRPVYLHAQLPAIPLYSKFGFKPQGELFTECNIQHYKMVKA